jgi:two-component system nitrogen regulation response regulator GlnG
MHAYDYEPPRGGEAIRAVWIVDDDRSIRWVLEKALAREGIAYKTFSSAYEVLQALAVSQPQVLVSDIRMPGESGISLLTKVKERFPHIPVIVMTAYSDLDSAVQAFQGGAFEYLPKPFDVDHAVALIRRATSETPVVSPIQAASTEPPEILGQAPAMQEVFRAIGRLSQSNATVLITGESGTGKELVARALHRHSPRAAGPFIAINTAAIPKDLLESELFGHERGAFTGAQSARRGRFEQSEGGTLFLDEIGDMPPDLQVRLLRVLSDGEYYRVGGHAPLKSNVRVIAGDAPEPRGACAAGIVPRGPAAPAQRRPVAPAAAARAPRGHSAARPPLHAEERARARRRYQGAVRRRGQGRCSSSRSPATCGSSRTCATG